MSLTKLSHYPVSDNYQPQINTKLNSNNTNSFSSSIPIIGDLINLFSQLYTNKKNRQTQEDINQKNLDYAKEMTLKQWERDDTTYQRSVEDAVAAGFSPLAVLDGGTVPNSGAINQQAQAYQGQAPQLDINSLANLVLSNQNRQFQLNENEKNRQHDIDLLNDQLQNNLYYADHNTELQKILQDNNFQNQLQLQNAQNQFTKLNTEFLQAQETARLLIQETGMINIDYIDDYEEWKTQYTEYQNQTNQLLEQLREYTDVALSFSAGGVLSFSDTQDYSPEVQTLIEQYKRDVHYPYYSGPAKNNEGKYYSNPFYSPSAKYNSSSDKDNQNDTDNSSPVDKRVKEIQNRRIGILENHDTGKGL